MLMVRFLHIFRIFLHYMSQTTVYGRVSWLNSPLAMKITETAYALQKLASAVGVWLFV